MLRGSRAQWRYVEDREVPTTVKVRIQLRYYYIDDYYNCADNFGSCADNCGKC